MEVDVKEIIDRIHAEGVKSAEERAREIIERAEQRAREIRDQANRDAEASKAAAEAEIAKRQAAADAALRQASRDLILSVRQKLQSIFAAVTQEGVAAAMSPAQMATIISTIVTKWAQEGTDEVTVLVSESDRSALESALRASLASTLKGGATVRPVEGLTAGFRISEGDDVAAVDFSAATIAELLAAYLNPRLAAVMSAAAEA